MGDETPEVPRDYEPRYEAIAEPGHFGRFQGKRLIQGWLVPTPKGARRGSHWVVVEGEHAATLVPARYKREPVEAEWLADLFVPVDERPLVAGGAVSEEVFLALADPFLLRKRDVVDETARTRAVIPFFANWDDTTAAANARGVAVPTRQFFRDNVARVTFDLTNARLGIESKHEKSEVDMEVAFREDPDIKLRSWGALRNGSLSAEVLGRPVHWANFTMDTLVGVDGPMLPLEHLASLPKLVYRV